MPVILICGSRPRPLARALLVSLVLHGLALSGGLLFTPMSLVAPPAPLAVVLREARPAPASIAMTHSQPPLPAKEVVPAVAATGPAVPARKPSTGFPAIAPVEAAQPAVASEHHAGAPAMPREGLDADAVRQYRLALAIAIRRHKYYPPAARTLGQEGRAEVVVQRMAAGAISAMLYTSSGFAELDEQAVAMLAQAAQVVPPPDALRQRDFRVLVPVQFRLAEE